MLTDKDMRTLQKMFVTKEEFTDLCVEVGEIKDEVTENKDAVFTKLDKFIGLLEAVQTDNGAGAQIDDRHNRQIQALAKGTGISIPQE